MISSLPATKTNTLVIIILVLTTPPLNTHKPGIFKRNVIVTTVYISSSRFLPVTIHFYLSSFCNHSLLFVLLLLFFPSKHTACLCHFFLTKSKWEVFILLLLYLFKFLRKNYKTYKIQMTSYKLFNLF